MTKEQLFKAAEDLPEEFNLAEFVRKLDVIEKVNDALSSYKAGNFLTNDEMGAEIEKIKMKYRRDAA